MTHERSTIPPLPRRIQPLPWEDFGSFLVRTAKHMGYETPLWVVKPETSSSHIKLSELPILFRQADFDFLSQLFLLPEVSLYHMTLHRFSSLFEVPPGSQDCSSLQQKQMQETTTRDPWGPIDQPLLPRNNGWSVLSKSKAIRICPLCAIIPHAYDRLYWRLEHLLTCPLHGVLLQIVCPICLKPWSSLRFSGACCPSCRHPIHQDERALQTQNHPEFSSLQQGDWLTLHMAGYEQSPHEIARFSSKEDFRSSLSPAQYFRLFNLFWTPIARLNKEALLTLLTPSFYEFVTLLGTTFPHTRRKHVSLQVAITHWICAGGIPRIFALFDTLTFHFFQQYPPSFTLFPHFPWSLSENDSSLFHLFSSFQQQYQCLYARQGITALEQRVLQRRELHRR